ncbi:MAG: ferritin [Clostridia bacterium]|nr:ferritin [Clostridia bacterium]
MLSEKLVNVLNEQIKYEMYSENLYLAMAAYCASEDLDGFSNFFKVQAEEEKFHAMKFFDYIIDMNGRAEIAALDQPENTYTSVLDAFKKAYEHEQLVTKRIYNLMDIAIDEREHATISFLKWFVDEQIEEESMFSNLLKKLERVGEDGHGIYMIDNELAKRVFTPPADA